MPQNQNCTTINFQLSRQLRDELHAAARRQERSASALIRIAVRAMLAGQPPPSEQAQQRDKQDSTATT
jgi:hypothetical protein